MSIKQEIRDFVISKIEVIENTRNLDIQVKGYEGVLNTLTDICEDLKLDLAGTKALIEIQNNNLN